MADAKPGRRSRRAEPEEDDAPPQRKVVEGGWGFGDSESKAVVGEEAKGDGVKPGRRRGMDSFAAQDADATADTWVPPWFWVLPARRTAYAYSSPRSPHAGNAGRGTLQTMTQEVLQLPPPLHLRLPLLTARHPQMS